MMGLAWMKVMVGQVVDSGYSLRTALSSFALRVCVREKNSQK